MDKHSSIIIKVITRRFMVVFFLLFAGHAHAQMSVEQITESFGISSNWAIEEDGSLSFSRVISTADPSMSKDVIYDKIQSYFSYNYANGKNVIQSSDKSSGYFIGKGIYQLFDEFEKHVGTAHIIKVECKDGKARVIITVDMYDERGSVFPAGINGPQRIVKITSMYPFTKFNKRTEKLTRDEKLHSEIFGTLIGVIDSAFSEIEKTINSGSSVLESQEW